MSTNELKEIEAVVRKNISVERFESYAKHGKGDTTIGIAFYLWNIALCEALYPSLNTVEVALRNQIHYVLTGKFGNEEWYDLDGFLHENEIDKVKESRDKLRKRNKLLKPGRIIAEMNFGFWTSLFGNHYEKFWYKPIRLVFPNKKNVSIKSVRQRLHFIKNLRNRVYHYECILKHSDLPILNQNVHEVIQWINPNLLVLIDPIDRYDLVYKSKKEHFLKGISGLKQMSE